MDNTFLTKSSRIAGDLLAGIRDGTYPPGGLLPTRQELCEKYGVSAVTARAAVQHLVRGGYVVSRQGVGSTVIPQQQRGRYDVADLQAAIYRLNQLTVKWAEMAQRDGYLDPATVHELPYACFELRLMVDRVWQQRHHADDQVETAARPGPTVKGAGPRVTP
jgi:DNA-binding GntR family transcriptional regulator